MRKRTVVGMLLIILVTLLLTGLPAAAVDEDPSIYIDIKPCQDPNVLNVNVIGWLPVAIYGDWELVDRDTVELERVPALDWREKEVYLLAKFDAVAVIDTFDNPQNGEVLKLCLTGEFVDNGGSFTACDDVTILKRGNR